MIYLDNTTDTQEMFIPRKEVEPEYSPMNRPLTVFIDNVNVQDNVMTYLRTVEPQSKDEGYSTVTVNMEVQMQQERLTDNGLFSFNMPVGTVEVNVDNQCNLEQLNAEFEDYDGEGNYWQYADEYGVDGFNYISINASAYGSQKYEEGYNQGYQEGENAGGGPCKLTTLEVTENGTYFPPITPVLVFDGDDVFDFAYADTPNAIEIRFKVNGSGWIFGNEKAGLFAESTDSILVYWFGYEGRYDINDGEVNTILIKPYDTDSRIILNGNEYNISEREIDNTDTEEIFLGNGNFNFYYAMFWSGYAEYNNGQTPLFYYLPNTDGNIKRSIDGGDFEVLSNRGGGVCQYTETIEFDGFSRVDVNVETTTEGGDSCNLGQLNAEFEDRLDGECWWYADEYGVDGFNYVSINASAYGSQKYEEGYNERNNTPLQPINVADIIALANSLEVGASTPKIYFMRPTISRISQIDLDYGNAIYWVTDDSGEEIEVFGGKYYWGSNFLSESDIQVGQTVNLVCAVQNYNGNPQIPENSYLLYI